MNYMFYIFSSIRQNLKIISNHFEDSNVHFLGIRIDNDLYYKSTYIKLCFNFNSSLPWNYKTSCKQRISIDRVSNLNIKFTTLDCLCHKMSIHHKLVTPSLYDLETVMKQKKIMTKMMKKIIWVTLPYLRSVRKEMKNEDASK